MTFDAIEVLLTIDKITAPLVREYHSTKAAVDELLGLRFIEPVEELPSRYVVSIEGQKYLSRLIALK